jgi:hypothetical protein
LKLASVVNGALRSHTVHLIAKKIILSRNIFVDIQSFIEPFEFHLPVMRNIYTGLKGNQNPRICKQEGAGAGEGEDTEKSDNQ